MSTADDVQPADEPRVDDDAQPEEVLAMAPAPARAASSEDPDDDADNIGNRRDGAPTHEQRAIPLLDPHVSAAADARRRRPRRGGRRRQGGPSQPRSAYRS
jgi:hypothetical protein